MLDRCLRGINGNCELAKATNGSGEEAVGLRGFGEGDRWRVLVARNRWDRGHPVVAQGLGTEFRRGTPTPLRTDSGIQGVAVD